VHNVGDYDPLERAVDGLKRKPRPLANGPISVTFLRAGIHAGEARFTRWPVPAGCRSWPRRAVVGDVRLRDGSPLADAGRSTHSMQVVWTQVGTR